VTRSSAELLDAPEDGELPEFPDVVVGGWGDLVSRLRALREALRTETASVERAQLLFLDALRSIRSLRDGGERLPALRSTTRAELVRRLQRARDYIDARLPDVRPLREIARVACLSPFHLQRCFAIAFRESPAVYASRRRLEQAAHLVATTRRPLAEIAADVGFSSQTAFTRSFRRWRGVSPGACRAAARSRR
jgi:AraC family transcriptional regulator